MRVAFVSMETTHHGGSEGKRRFERVARHLADRGHDVTVFCAQWWDEHEQTRERDGVTYHGVTVGPAVSSFTVRVPVLLARHRPDVVHARPDPPVAAVAAGVGATLARAPFLVEWFGDESLADSWARGRAASRPQRVVTPSEMVRTEVRELGATEETTTVIPECIEMDAVRDAATAEEVDVVYAHHLGESANLENLLLGLAELRDRDWSAAVVGDGPRREEYESQAADLRIDDRIEFLGACDRAERLATYRGAHAFVQTADREYFATELLWAMACGCVGIVEYQPESSAHELIENYRRSFRVTNPQQIADAIADAGKYERLTVDDRWADYDRDAVLEEYLECYRDLQSEFGLL